MVGDVHDIFTQFKEEYGEVYRLEQELGQYIHTQAGPLGEPTRWLLKVAISAAAGRHRALETHLLKAREAGVSDEELRQTLLLLIPTIGFPGFMEAYQTYKGLSG